MDVCFFRPSGVPGEGHGSLPPIAGSGSGGLTVGGTGSATLGRVAGKGRELPPDGGLLYPSPLFPQQLFPFPLYPSVEEEIVPEEAGAGMLYPDPLFPPLLYPFPLFASSFDQATISGTGAGALGKVTAAAAGLVTDLGTGAGTLSGPIAGAGLWPVPPTPASDGEIYDDVKARLRKTGAFSQIIDSERKGPESGDRHRIAKVIPISAEDTDLFHPDLTVRNGTYQVVIEVRHEDPAKRRQILDKLCNEAKKVLNEVSLATITLPSKTIIRRSPVGNADTYQQSVTLEGHWTYLTDGINQFFINI